MMMTKPLVQALVAHFDSVYEGPNGDYPAVLEAIAGLTAPQAAWKPVPDCNSIWQMVDHLAASKIWQIEMLEKGQAASPVWTQGIGDENAWQAAVERLRQAHLQLKAALDNLPEESLLQVPAPEWNRTLLELLLSIAAHEAYHGGQIDYLKGLQTRSEP
jgi:uncharacterized damage-inducible protein DinB